MMSSDQNSASRLAKLYIIAYLRWEREWYETFEVGRSRLLDTLSRLRQEMERKPDTGAAVLESALLGGQTVILEDLASVRPDLLTLLVIYNAGGRLGVGPWYVIVDEALVSGESLVRNLLAARADVSRWGLRMMSVAYAPGSSGHVAQLPQILRGFGIDSAFLRHGAPVVHLPFCWEAPDGSYLLVVNHELLTHWPVTIGTVDDVVKSVNAQRGVRPDGPFVWLFDLDNTPQSLVEMQGDVTGQLEVPTVQADLQQYVRILREELPDTARPSLQGELRLQALREKAYLWPGTLSTRIYLKQANARMQAYLIGAVEPWLAVALTHGNVRYPQNLLALLNHSWRLLLKSQARNALGGCGDDAVHEENEIRYRQVADSGAQVISRVLDALPGRVQRPGVLAERSETYIVVWNSHNWSVRQCVEVALTLTPGKYPARLLTPEGNEQAFSWRMTGNLLINGGMFEFLADAPPIGSAVYTVELADAPPEEQCLVQRSSGSSIRGVTGEQLSMCNGRLDWDIGDTTIRDVLQFHDGGDAGDVYNYSPPYEDVVVKADLTDNTQIETTPFYERLIVQHRMRVAPSLTPDRRRSRGLKLLELTTSATFYDHVPGIFFRTTFNNLAKDHRLRVHLRTSLRTSTIMADSAFGFIERPAALGGAPFPPPDAQYMEGVSDTHPMQTVIAATDYKRSIGLLARGLPEYEALLDDKKRVTFALTLVRAVGWLSRSDLRTRTCAVAPMIAIPGAQCQRRIAAEYGLLVATPDDRMRLLRAGQSFAVPLQAYQYCDPPENRHCSFLTITSDMVDEETGDDIGVILTALKPPEHGEGWIVRLLNPHDHPVEARLLPYKHPSGICRVTLAEDVIERIHIEPNGVGVVRLTAQQIVTVRVEF